MKLHFKQLVLIFTLNLTINLAYAVDLSKSNINDYLKSIEQLQNSDSKEIRALENSLKNNQNFKFDTDKDGKIRVVTHMLSQINDDQESVLLDIVEDSGFSSLSQWADVADRVTAAMLAVEMKKNPMDMDMSELTPEMLEMMPPAAKEQMQAVLRVVKAVEKVPAEDIEIVQANYAKLSKFMK